MPLDAHKLALWTTANFSALVLLDIHNKLIKAAYYPVLRKQCCVSLCCFLNASYIPVKQV